MSFNLPEMGGASKELMHQTHQWWIEAVKPIGIDASGLNFDAPLSTRIAWANAHSFTIGTAYTRFSTDRQSSTEAQVRAIVLYAASHGIYILPEFVCVDEAKKGRTQSRPGLDRMKQILLLRLAVVLVIFKLSRLFRLAHATIRFFRETLVDRNLRGISVTEGIDTAEKRTWRLQTGIHGLMDEELLEAIADHVREGLVGLFHRGWVTGALPIGYCPKELPGGPRTRRNLPRMVPEIDPEAGKMILEHYQSIADGMDISAGWRKWRAENGSVDPRSTTGKMSYEAYRRMLQRQMYTGRVEFCRKKNVWSSADNSVHQEIQPEREIKTFQCDELFLRVQRRLAEMRLGPRPKSEKVHKLADLVIGVHECSHCKVRFYMTGAEGRYMRCSNPDCPVRAMVHREDAVAVECKALAEAMSQDTGLIDLVLASFATLTDEDRTALDEKIADLDRRARQLAGKIREIEELAGVGDDEDRQRRNAQIRAAQSERTGVQLELADLKRQQGGGRREPVTRDQVQQQLCELKQMLDDAAGGKLGPEVVALAASVFRELVGGVITVYPERRRGRDKWIIKATFVPKLLKVIRDKLGAFSAADGATGKVVEVCLRKSPRVDLIADEVQHHYDVEKLGFRKINQLLEKKYGEKVGTGNCCAAYHRYYEVHGLPTPPRRGNSGRPRKAA